VAGPWLQRHLSASAFSLKSNRCYQDPPPAIWPVRCRQECRFFSCVNINAYYSHSLNDGQQVAEK
jgi:hypothetical protein